MAITSSGARASRRSAATAARQTAASQPVSQTPEVLADVVDDEAEAAFGPDDVITAPKSRRASGSQSAVNTEQVSQINAEDSEASTGQQRAAAQALTRTPVAAGGAIALPMEDLTRKIEANDLVIPKLRISQAMSKVNTLAAASGGTDGVGMGNWYQSVQQKNLGKTIYFIPVDMRKSRAMFVTGEGLMCRSFDLLQGEGDPGGLCEGTPEERLTVPAEHRGCPLRLWNDKTPPRCGMTYNYPGLVVEDIEGENPKVQPVLLQLRSTATGTARQINTIVANDGGGVWSDVILELGVESKSNTRGTFFVPTAEYYDTTDTPEFARIRRRAQRMAEQMGATTLRASIEDDSD